MPDWLDFDMLAPNTQPDEQFHIFETVLYSNVGMLHVSDHYSWVMGVWTDGPPTPLSSFLELMLEGTFCRAWAACRNGDVHGTGTCEVQHVYLVYCRMEMRGRTEAHQNHEKDFIEHSRRLPHVDR